MRDRSEIWCETSDISINEIERRSRLAYERTGVVALVYISMELYAEILKQMGTSTRLGPTFGPSSNALISINSSAGQLHIQKVSKYRNFLFVGVKEEYEAFVNMGVDPIYWSDQERAKVDKEFENIVILDGE